MPEQYEQINVYKVEYKLKTAVFDAASDWIKACYDSEFSRINGGENEMQKRLEHAIYELEQWYADGEADYC